MGTTRELRRRDLKGVARRMRDQWRQSRTTLSFGGPTPIELEVQLWALGRTSHVRPSAASACALSTAGVASCSRRYNTPNTTGFVAPWTALASRVVGKKAAADHVLEEVRTGWTEILKGI